MHPQLRLADADPPTKFLTRHKATLKLLKDLTRIAATDVSVLFTGETGVGKELVARRIHERSARSDKPFVAVDCAAIPLDVAESELFGHAQGAFTGSTSQHDGFFQAAEGGTIFLDEVGNLHPRIQPKLLRTLESKTVRRVGETQERPIDFRLVCATNEDLRSKVARGEFREDLYYRIARFGQQRIAPLRSRREDIPLIAAHYMARFSRAYGARSLSQEVAELLLCYNWPGNVRELVSALERMFVLTDQEAEFQVEDLRLPQSASFTNLNTRAHYPKWIAELLDTKDTVEPLGLELPSARTSTPAGDNLVVPVGTLREIEGEVIREYIRRNPLISVAALARLLGISRQTLYPKIKRHGITRNPESRWKI